MRLKDMPVLERDDTALDRVVALQEGEVDRQVKGLGVKGWEENSLGVKAEYSAKQ